MELYMQRLLGDNSTLLFRVLFTFTAAVALLAGLCVLLRLPVGTRKESKVSSESMHTKSVCVQQSSAESRQAVLSSIEVTLAQ